MAGCTVRRVTELTQLGRRKPKTGRAALLALAITAVVAGAAGLAYLIGWGIAEDKQPSAGPSAVTDVATQLECTAVKREYDAWRKAAGLEEIERLRGKLVSFATKKALDDGEALAKATTGYNDEPAVALAAAVAQYNVQVAFLNLGASATNDYEDLTFQEAMAARGEVNTKFNEFWAKTCS